VTRMLTPVSQSKHSSFSSPARDAASPLMSLFVDLT
jgi:hypothetical protein